MRYFYMLPLLLFCFFTKSLTAQTLEVDWGSFQEIEKDNFIHEIVGSDGDGIYVLRSESIIGLQDSKISLDYYSNVAYERETSNELLMPTVDGQETQFEKLFIINNRLIMFTSLASTSKKKKLAFIQYINKDGTLKNKPKEIGELSLSNGEYGFEYKLSEDGSKILMHYQKFFKEYVNEPFNFKIFDSNLNEEFAKEVTMPFAGRHFEITQYLLSNNGNILMSVKAVQESKRKSSTSADEKYDFILLGYDTQKNEFFQEAINAGKNVPHSVLIAVNKEDEVVIAGLQSPKTARNGDISGMFYMTYNPSIRKVTSPGIETKKTFILFSRELIAEFAHKRNGELKNQFSYQPTHLFILSDGGFVLLAEHSFTDTTSFKDPGTTNMNYVYYYNRNDILAGGVDATGMFTFAVRIPKNQYGTNDNGYYSSYYADEVGTKVKIIFNDNPSNQNTKDPEKIKQFKTTNKTNPKALSMVTTIYNDGSIDKQVLFNNADEKTSIIPSVITKGKDRYYIGGFKGKFVKYGSFFLQ